MEHNKKNGIFMSTVQEYQGKIWLFWLSLFWFMYAAIVSTGNLPAAFTSPAWRIWAFINGVLVLIFFLIDPCRVLKVSRVRLAMVSIVGFCVVRSFLYIYEGRYAIVPVWGLIATLSLHAYKTGRLLDRLNQALSKKERDNAGNDLSEKLDEAYRRTIPRSDRVEERPTLPPGCS